MNEMPLTTGVLTEAAEEAESVTPREAVARIQATPANPSQVRLATANLAAILRAAPDDFGFDREDWNRRWAAVEAEMKAVARANDLAEGRRG